MAILYNAHMDIDEQGSAPPAPGAGTLNMYARSTGLKTQSAAGVETDLDGQTFPAFVRLWGRIDADVIGERVGLAPSIAVESNQRHNMFSFANPAMGGVTRIGWTVNLDEGLHTLHALTIPSSSNGFMVLRVDGVPVAGVDLYRVSTAYNVVDEIPFTLERAGAHSIVLSSMPSPEQANQITYLLITKVWIKKQ